MVISTTPASSGMRLRILSIRSEPGGMSISKKSRSPQSVSATNSRRAVDSIVLTQTAVASASSVHITGESGFDSNMSMDINLIP